MPLEHKYFHKMPQLQDLLAPLIRKRAGFKSRVTVALKCLEEIPSQDLIKETFLRHQETIDQYLQKVLTVNEEIWYCFSVCPTKQFLL